MLAALLLAARVTLPLDSTVLLIRVLDVSDARVGGDAILITDASAGRARLVLIDAGEHGATIVARLTSLRGHTRRGDSLPSSRGPLRWTRRGGESLPGAGIPVRRHAAHR